MANYREPAKRRRVEVPISPGRSPKQRRPAQRPYQQNVNDTNRALINAGIVAVTTVLTTVLLLAISGQIRDTTTAGLSAQSASPLAGGIYVQPTPQSSLVMPTPTSQPTRSEATPSPEAETETETPAPVATPDDVGIQAALDQKLGADASLSALGITATVNDGKVILVGTAPSDEMKGKIEKLVRSIKGVKQIDNQIVVISNL